MKAKNVFIDEKNYKHLVVYFTGYHRGNSIRILGLYYNESVRRIEE